MNTKNTTAVSSENETLELVNPKTLVKNGFKAALYKEDSTYDWLRHNVKTFGIREPIIADVKSKMVISGNRRLKAALELGLTEVPVIFRELEKDKFSHNAIFVSHEVQREKTYSQYLTEYKILRERFPMTQGTRTDLGEGVPNIELQSILSQISRSTMFYLVKIDEMAKAKYPGGESSDTYKRIWKELDNGVTTPSKWYNKLLNEDNVKETEKKIKENSFAIFDCRFLNKSCEDLTDLLDYSVSCIVSRPPFWGFDKNDEKETFTKIGTEENFEEYITNLVNIYKVALPKLKKGGSIWVNLSETFKKSSYNLIPHRFAIEMMKKLNLTVNDEIIWTMPPKQKSEKRGVRGFEYIFQFVRRGETHSVYHDSTWLDEINDTRDMISVKGGGMTKNPSSYWNFREGVLETKFSNISKLRNACKKLGIKSVENTSLPFDVAMIPILSSTAQGETVVDLFGDIGTTALVAGALKRKSISYESNPEKCKTAHVLMGELISLWEREDVLSNKSLIEIVNETDIALAA